MLVIGGRGGIMRYLIGGLTSNTSPVTEFAVDSWG